MPRAREFGYTSSAVNLHVGLLTALLGTSAMSVPPAATQPRSNEVRVGTKVVSYEAPVTGEQAGELAALLERTRGGAEGVSARLSGSEDGYSLWLAFPGETWRQPQSLQSASLAGRLASAAVLDGAPLTVHVSDSALESRQTVRIELAPEDIFFYRGEALVVLQRNVAAIEQFRRAVELRSKETRYLLRYGEALFLDWRDAEAERAFRTALELEPNNARAHFLMGKLTFQVGQLNEALPFYRRAVELQPDFVRAHEMLASTYDLLGRFDAAIAHYERAIQLAPSGTLYNELGITYRNKKQIVEAIAQFRAGIELFPDHALLHRNLASTLVTAGRGDQSGPVFSRALQLHRRAAESEPENPRSPRESRLHDGPSSGL